MELVPTSRFGYSEIQLEQPQSLSAPRSAILMAGSNSVAYVETEPGRFEIRKLKLGPILRDRVIILEGLEEGEQVATAGNFLIDSQMQLEGKPSLIDPTRIVTMPPGHSNLHFTSIDVQHVQGTAGEQLEELYAAYFRIQQTLVGDDKPMEKDVQALQELAAALKDSSLGEKEKTLVAAIASDSEHLHTLSLKTARMEFRPVSRAIIELATRVRGAEAAEPFHHFYCPMVDQGNGDWLQANDKLRNPYFGSQMIRCGETVHTIPSQGTGAQGLLEQLHEDDTEDLQDKEKNP
jgi:Cu(I)/Ag(I) efflux system membrane fusion protein